MASKQTQLPGKKAETQNSPQQQHKTPSTGKSKTRDADVETSVESEQTIGGYRLEEPVGEGGFGVVYRAVAPDGRTVALKRLHASGAAAEELAYEFRVLSRLRHPNILPVRDFGFHEESPYLVTDWIAGRDIATALQSRPLAELAPALADVLRALEYLHARGVLHRDLKPQNVLVDERGRAHLIDFGLAGLTGRGGSRSGTPAFVPPERLLGQPEDARADLYSFGVLLHLLVYGDLPGQTPTEPHDEARRLAPLLERLLAPNPAARPASANEVIAELSQLSGVSLEEERGSDPATPQLHVPGLVGRDRELAWFRKRIREPRHRIVLIEGEAGVGKSHLLRAFAAEATVERARVLAGETLSDLTPSFGVQGEHAADRLLAEALTGRVVVLIDDVHRRSPAELEEILGLLTRLDVRRNPAPRRGLIIVLSYRGSELGARGLREQIERARALKRTRTLRLRPLAPEQLPALVTELLGRHGFEAPFFRALHERTGGRPAAVRDLLRALRLEGAIDWRDGAWRLVINEIRWPQSPEQALAATLEQLEPIEKEVLLWLRTAGQATLAELREWTGDPTLEPTRLNRLANEHELIVASRHADSGTRFALASDRIAALLGPDPESGRRHDILAAAYRGERKRYLHHAAHGTSPDAARSALEAARSLRPHEPLAARRLLAALSEGKALSGTERVLAEVELAAADLDLERVEAARARLDALHEVPSTCETLWLETRARALGPNDEGRTRVLARIETALAGPDGLRFTGAALTAARAIETASAEARGHARALADQVLQLARQQGDTHLRARALLVSGLLDRIEDADDDTRARLEKARHLFRTANDLKGELDATLQLVDLHLEPDQQRIGAALAEEALALAERLGDPLELARTLRTRARLMTHSGDLRGARRMLRRARALIVGRGALADYLGLLASSAYVALKLGRAREAERHTRRVLRLAVGEAHALPRLYASANLAFALIRQGRRADRPATEALHEARRRGLDMVAEVASYLLALDAVERGELAAAGKILGAPIQESSFHLRCLRVDFALLLGDTARAKQALEALPPSDSAFLQSKHAVRQAMVALTEGAYGQALAACEQARTSGGLSGDHYLAIELGLCECEALLGSGDRKRAEAVLSDTLHRIGHARSHGFRARALILRERLGGLGLPLTSRLDELRALLDRLESQELWRDTEALAAVLAARLGSESDERATLERRRLQALERMCAGLPEAQARTWREWVEQRTERQLAALPLDVDEPLPQLAVTRLLSVYRALARERDPDELLPRVLDAAAGLVGAARAFLLLQEGTRLRVVYGRGSGMAIDAREGGPSRTIAEQALASGHAIRLEAAYLDERFATTHSVAVLGIGGLLAIPFDLPTGASGSKSERRRGVIYLDDGGAGRAFSEEDEAVLRAFADQAALALATANALREEQRRRERAEASLGALRERLMRTSADLATVRSVLEQQLGRIEHRFEGMIGRSDGMQRVFKLVERFAPRDVPVLITGATGTGKELTARAIHARSSRRAQPFVAVNCGAITPSLLEAELFGHEAGAFTGAIGRKQGLFEQADGGTIFLDEIGETSPEMQAALLRVLDTGELRRVGGKKTIRVDVRVIAATNRDLAAMVHEDRFRQDLLFRLNVVEIALPPLRERLEDVEPLAEAMIKELAEASGAERPPALSRAAKRRLLSHDYPGNVRELRNVIARAVVLCDGSEIREDDIVFDTVRRRKHDSSNGSDDDIRDIIDFQVAKEHWIRRYLEAALRRTGGNVTRAAELTGMKRQALGRLLKRHGVDAARFRQ